MKTTSIVFSAALAFALGSPALAQHKDHHEAAQAAPDTLYDGLEARDSDTFDEVMVRDGWTPAGTIQHASVVVNLRQDEFDNIPARDIEHLRATFEEQLAEHTDANGTITLEVTLTELEPNTLIGESGSRLSGPEAHTGVGGAAMEATFRDAATGEVLMIIRDSRNGRPYGTYTNPNARAPWADADEIIDEWSEELPAAL